MKKQNYISIQHKGIMEIKKLCSKRDSEKVQLNIFCLSVLDENIWSTVYVKTQLTSHVFFKSTMTVLKIELLYINNFKIRFIRIWNTLRKVSSTMISKNLWKKFRDLLEEQIQYRLPSKVCFPCFPA